tara:strand:- start:591 stop:1556 length:966 start_codon:yes stop_codon:yes gene_type:complete
MRFENLEVRFEKEEIKIPVFRFGKVNSSKRLVVLGGVHGNEINGIGVLKEIVSYLSNSKVEDSLNAEIICLPVVNVLGFKNFTRRFQNQDLNRSYSSNPSDLAEQICFDIFNAYIKDATFCLDFHDSGSNYELLLHSRMAPDNSLLVEMTKAMLIKHSLVRKPKIGMLADFASQCNVPVLTIESGGGGRLHDIYLEQIMFGFKNFLCHFSFFTDKLNSTSDISFNLIELKTRFKYKLSSTAIVKYHVKLGQKVNKSQLICTVYEPSTASEFQIFSKKDGYVFSLSAKNIVTAKKLACDIALDCCDYNVNTNPEIFEVIKVT